MTTKSKADNSESIAATESSSVEASAEASAKIVAQPVAEIADIVSSSLVVIEEAVETASESFSTSFKLDSSTFAQKSLDLWSENATAFFSFLEQFARVKSFEEAVELQTRFANECLDAFLRQSKELMEAARDMADLSTAPLSAAKKAA